MDLAAGEEIVWQGRPSWRAMLAFYMRWIALAAIVGIGGQVLASTTGWNLPTGWFWGFALLLLLGTLAVGYLRRLTRTYVVTNRRIYVRTGLVSRDLHSTSHERIQSVNTRQTVFQRMLDVGDVDFDTAATDDFEFVFAGCDRPHDVARRVTSLEDSMHGEGAASAAHEPQA
jgi:uncharacterized membrane protein YdbT with pleckstrin-like domain